jgi:hypothetical protein
MRARTKWYDLASIALAAGLGASVQAQCNGDKIFDDNPGILVFAGSAVDIYGERCLLGAPGYGTGGRVLFFERSAPQQWFEVEEIVGPGGGAADYYGSAVAIYSTFAAVGARETTVGADSRTGRVFIYRRVVFLGSVAWVLDATIDNPSPDDDDLFGTAVDIDSVGGTITLAIGCPGDDLTGAAQAGRVRIYTRNADGSGWTLQDSVTMSTPQADANFGSSVCLDGDRLLVGAPNEDVSGLSNAGAAYLFTRDGSDWGTGSRFTASATYRDAGDLYGADVAISGNRIAIGVPGEDEGLETNAGAIFAYRLSLFWIFEDRLLSFSPDAFDEIGEQIDMKADTLVAGDPSNNFCLLWHRGPSESWVQSFPFVATEPPKSDSHSFGSDVALTSNGEYVLIGDAADDLEPDAGGAGSAYIFTTDQNPGSTCDGGFFDPVPIVNDGDQWFGCNGGGTNGSVTSSCAPSTNGDAWYQFDAPCNGLLRLSTCGTNDLGDVDSGIDTVLSVHSSCPGTAGNQIACNDDGSGACGVFVDQGAQLDSSLTVAVQAGENYRIRVASYGGSATGLFVLNVHFACCRVDWDGNGVVNSTDVSSFINDWFADIAGGTTVTDFDGNGVVNSTDVSMFINEWFEGCTV